MSARLLVLVMPGQDATALAALPALVATARHERLAIHIACFQPLPPPREDRHGRVVADTDREMARLTATTEATFAAASRVFGRPAREARLEVEALTPDVVASFEGRGALGAIRYLISGARRSAASASAASRPTRSAAFWRRAMRTP